VHDLPVRLPAQRVCFREMEADSRALAAGFPAETAACDSAGGRACLREVHLLSLVADSREPEARRDSQVRLHALVVDFPVPVADLPALAAVRYSSERQVCLLDFRSLWSADSREPVVRPGLPQLLDSRVGPSPVSH